MFTETEIEEIYASGGHPKAWKVLKRVFGIIWSFLPITILIIFLTEEKEEAIRMITFLCCLGACMAPPTGWLL
jgi:hypothetical protein